MGQKKLQRFQDVKSFSNVYEFPTGMQGNWHNVFKNNNAVTLELACGKGEYTIGLSSMYPERNFIGVDIKGNRIWKGAITALQKNLNNAAFLRTEIDMINHYFADNEVSEIWLTFPDPQLRMSKAKKRLTHPRFLRLYKQIIKPEGVIHLKTDSPDLYYFTKTVINLYELRLLNDLEDVYGEEDRNLELNIVTHYEKMDIAQSRKIYYLQFKVNADLSLEKDEVLKNILREQNTKTVRRFLF